MSTFGDTNQFSKVCTCGTSFLSSDGTGTNVAGDNGDCGRTTGISACGGETSCSGAGTCSGSSAYQCTCFSGFTGYDCSLRTCNYGAAWFDEATTTNTAHAMVECSNRGLCDRTTGMCSLGCCLLLLLLVEISTDSFILYSSLLFSLSFLTEHRHLHLHGWVHWWCVRKIGLSDFW